MFFFPYTSDNIARNVIWFDSPVAIFLFWRSPEWKIKKSRDDNQESGKSKGLSVDEGHLFGWEIFYNFHADIKNEIFFPIFWPKRKLGMRSFVNKSECDFYSFLIMKF